MLQAVMALPEKAAFFLGLVVILLSEILLFVITLLLPFPSSITIIIKAIVWFMAFLMILSAADKRRLRLKKKK
ncbi:hypothetical protein D3H55_14215 [Bacillus salacetis]|uniref:Uncharacterized protein n=1 Tax=Bacillus salacetis TaxID=2315464 RepID=A0A3A1QXZ8_9BACI|nr:hypothetical protein [Bacillus salacetis]RIW32026.1 hypothetical protein D3H55_14215 [Bacillus salacetis]